MSCWLVVLMSLILVSDKFWSHCRNCKIFPPEQCAQICEEFLPATTISHLIAAITSYLTPHLLVQIGTGISYRVFISFIHSLIKYF